MKSRRVLPWCLIILAAAAWLSRGWIAERVTFAQDTVRGQANAADIEARVAGTVREYGSLEAASTLEVRSRIPGTTTLLWIVPEGTKVKQGELVARLDDSQIRTAHSQQRIAVASAVAEVRRSELALSLAKNERSFGMKIVELKAEIVQQKYEAFSDQSDELGLKIRALQREQRIGKVRLDTRQRTLSLVEQSADAGTTSGNGVEQAKLAVQEAMAALENAEAQLEFLQKTQRAMSGAELKLELLQAESATLRQRHELDATERSATADLEAAKQSLEVETSRLQELESQLASCELRAPRDGVIVYVNAASRRTEPTVIEVGATIRERQPIIQMPELDQLRARVRVHESRINRVRRGQTARFQVDALPNEQFTGKVIEVGKMPEPTTFLNPDVKEYSVLVSIDKPVPLLRIGMTCVVEIDTATRDQ